jgi:hypothetical protein
MVTGTIAGCDDEGAPETYVKRLSDPGHRPAAAGRLIQFFEDAMTRDNKDRNGPTVKPLLDKIVEPMTQACVGGDLDEKTNSKIIKFLSDARDPRGEGCLVKALKDYKVDSTEEDIRWAVRAVAAMKLKGAAGPLYEVFAKMRPSKPKASGIYLDVNSAIIELADPSWESQMIAMLGRPINDLKDVVNLKDEVFWQVTSARYLGIIKSQNAIKPLIKVVLSPLKADIAAEAITALIKIGKPSLAAASALLKSEDKELMEFSKGENLKGAAGADGKVPDAAKKLAETAHISTAALIIGTLGREEGIPPLIDAISKAEDLPRAIMARELSKLPKTADSVKAFQTAYEKTPVSLSIPPGMGARETLLEAGGAFFDASFTPWIVKTSIDMKGDSSDIDPIRAAALTVAMKLMTKDQITTVDKLYEMKSTGPDGKQATLGKAYEKEYKIAKDLLNACGDKVECFLAKVADPASQKNESQFQGIKAAYMLGVHGSPDVRGKIIEVMPKVTNAAVRFVAVSVIDVFSPKGDATIAGQLQKIVDEGEASKDNNRMQGNAPFKTVIYRMTARAAQ